MEENCQLTTEGSQHNPFKPLVKQKYYKDLATNIVSQLLVIFKIGKYNEEMQWQAKGDNWCVTWQIRWLENWKWRAKGTN